ncbi:MAG: DUF2610 domain-containing protein [Alphaproteobacteria bacterium]|nr:DUF2610 domain-containing protein [Alphaproteobacteria bacterium]
MDMEVLNIPCIYPEKEKRSQRFVFGTPHDAFNPLHFQRLWYKMRHQAIVPPEIVKIMKRLQEIAQGSRITFCQLLQYAMDDHGDADTPMGDAQRFSEENIIDIANLITQKNALAEHEDETALMADEIIQNPLQQAWRKGEDAKTRSIDFAVAQILPQGAEKSPEALILQFLLALEGRTPAQILEETERENLSGLTYKISLYADCFGNEIPQDVLKRLDKWLQKPYEFQVNTLVALYEHIEAWVVSPLPPPMIPYNLSSLHFDMAQYITPRQSDNEDMQWAEALLAEGAELPSPLKAIAVLQSLAKSGDKKAQARLKKIYAAMAG